MSVLRKINRRKSVFITILVSYLVIFLFPVSIGSFLYQRIEKIMINDANNTNMGLLEQVKLVAENRFKEVDSMTVQVAINPKLQWSLNNIDEDYPRSQFNFFDMMNTMKNVRNISSFIGNFFVYFKNTETVLTSTGKSDADTFFHEILVYDGKSLDAMIGEMFTGSRSKAYLPAAPIKEGGKTSYGITYVQSLPLGEKTDIKGYMVVLIKEQEFDSLIKQIEKVNRSSIYIVDEHQQVMLSASKDHKLSPELLSKLVGENGYDTLRQDEGEMILSYTTGPSGLKYISILPKQVVLEQVIEVKNGAVALLLFCLAAGIFISYWMAYRNYSPIREVVRALTEESGVANENAANEFDFIKQSIARSLEEKNRLRQTLSQQKPAIQANFLSRLVKGHVEMSAIGDDSLQFMGVRFGHDYFCAIIVEIDDCRDFIKEDTEREWAIVRFILTNMGKELFGERGNIAEMDRNRLALLYNVPEPTEAIREERASLIRQLQSVATQRFKLSITIAVSPFYRGVDEIGRCYREALIALDYRMIYGSNAIIYHDDIAGMDVYQYHYPLESEVQLMNLAKSGDYASAEKLLNQIYQANFQSAGISPEMGKFLFVDLLSTIVKVMNGLQISDKSLFAADPAKVIADHATAEEMLHQTKELYRQICAITKERNTDYSDRLYARICEYINERFDDSNLSLTSIADHFQISHQYVSTFFKKHSGENISDYLAAVRIREAKKMLAERGMTMSEIAQKIGYANAVSFVRFFKKIEGVTPGKYRDMLDRPASPEND